MKRIDVEGVGVIDFPDDMSDAEIGEVLDREFGGKGANSPLLASLFPSIERGFRQFQQGNNILLGEAGLQSSEDTAARVSELAARQEQIPPPASVKSFFEAPSFGEAWSRFLDAPFEIGGSIIGQSLGLAAPALLGVSPAALAGRVALGGAIGATSFLQEYAGKILESMGESGVNLRDPAAVAAALQDKTFMSEARSKGVKKGVPVAAFDALSGGLAGKLVAGSKGAASFAGRAAAETGGQMLAGAAGEAAGEYAAEGRVKPAEVMAEAIGELGGAGPEMAIGTFAGRRRVEPEPPPPVEPELTQQEADIILGRALQEQSALRGEASYADVPRPPDLEAFGPPEERMAAALRLVARREREIEQPPPAMTALDEARAVLTDEGVPLSRFEKSKKGRQLSPAIVENRILSAAQKEAERRIYGQRQGVKEDETLYAFPEGPAAPGASLDEAILGRRAAALPQPLSLTQAQEFMRAVGVDPEQFESPATLVKAAEALRRKSIEEGRPFTPLPMDAASGEARITPPYYSNAEIRGTEPREVVDFFRKAAEEKVEAARNAPLVEPVPVSKLEEYVSNLPTGRRVLIKEAMKAAEVTERPAAREALKPFVDSGLLKLDKGGSYTRTKKVPRLDTEPRFAAGLADVESDAEKLRGAVQDAAQELYGNKGVELIRVASPETWQGIAENINKSVIAGRTPKGVTLGRQAYISPTVSEELGRPLTYHEGWHIAQNLNLVPKEEQALLRKAKPKLLNLIKQARTQGEPLLKSFTDEDIAEIQKKSYEVEAYAAQAYGFLRQTGRSTGFLPLPVAAALEKIRTFVNRIMKKLGRDYKRPEDVFSDYLRGDYKDKLLSMLEETKATPTEKWILKTALEGGDPLQDTNWRKLMPRLNAFTYIFNTFGRAADKVPALSQHYKVQGDIRRQASTIVHEQLEKLQPLLGLTKEGRREITRFLDDDANNERLTPARVGAKNKGGTLKTAADVEAVEAVRSALKGMWQERIKAYKMRFGDKADPKILAELEAAERTAYLPSMRWGQWGVSVHDKDGKLLYLHTFSTPDAYFATKGRGLRPAKVAANYGNQLRRELAKQYPGAKIDDVYAMTYDSMRQFLEARDVAAIEKIAMGLGQLETMGLSQKQVDSYWSEIHDQVARGTWKRHQQRRKNIPGYLTESNVDRYLTSSLAAYIANGARFIARESNVPAMREAEEALAKVAGQAGGDRIQSFARGMVEYVNTPNFAVDFLKAVGYYNYLGANFSSAVMNLTQFLVATLPYAGMVGGLPGQRIALGAYGDAWQLLFKHPSLIFRGFNLKERPQSINEGEWQGLVSRFKDGSIRNATLEDITGSSPQLLGAVSSNASVWAQRTLDALTFFFSAAEGINRASAYLTGHRLYTNEKTRQGVVDALKGTRYEGQELTADLAGFAFMERTQANMSKENRPLFTRFTPAAEIATQFMSYPVQMAELFAEMAFGRGKAGKMAAASMMLALWSMAGLVGAVPGGEPAKELVEWGLKKATGKRWDLEEEIREVATGVLGLEGTEALLHGATRYLGIDTKQRASLGIIPVSPMEEVMRGPVGKMAYDQAVEAYNWYKEGRGDLAAAAFLPLALKNVYKAVSGRLEPLGPVTGSGDTLLRRPLSMPEYFTQGLGFTPKNVAREREYRREESELKDLSKDTRERYKERATMALANSVSLRRKGDERGALKYLQEFQSIVQEAAAHDRRVPPEEQARLNFKAIRKDVMQRVFGGHGKGEGVKIPKALRASLEEKLKLMPRGT